MAFDGQRRSGTLQLLVPSAQCVALQQFTLRAHCKPSSELRDCKLQIAVAYWQGFDGLSWRLLLVWAIYVLTHCSPTANSTLCSGLLPGKPFGRLSVAWWRSCRLSPLLSIDEPLTYCRAVQVMKWQVQRWRLSALWSIRPDKYAGTASTGMKPICPLSIGGPEIGLSGSSLHYWSGPI